MLDRENFFVYDNEPRDARRAGLEPLRYSGTHGTPESAPPPAGGGGVRVGCCTHSCFSDKAPPPGFVFFAHGSCAELRFIALAENRQTRTHACVSALAETGRLADAVILCLDTHQDHTPRRGQSRKRRRTDAAPHRARASDCGSRITTAITTHCCAQPRSAGCRR